MSADKLRGKALLGAKSNFIKCHKVILEVELKSEMRKSGRPPYRLRILTAVMAVFCVTRLGLALGPGSEQDYLSMGNIGICDYDSILLMNGVTDTLISFHVGGLISNDTFLTIVDSTYNEHLQGGNVARLLVDLRILSGKGDSAEIDSMWMIFVPDVKPAWGPFKNVDGSGRLVDSLASANDTYGVAGTYRFNAQRGEGGVIYKLPIWVGRGVYHVLAKQNPCFTDTNYVRTIAVKEKI